MSGKKREHATDTRITLTSSDGQQLTIDRTLVGQHSKTLENVLIDDPSMQELALPNIRGEPLRHLLGCMGPGGLNLASLDNVALTAELLMEIILAANYLDVPVLDSLFSFYMANYHLPNLESIPRDLLNAYVFPRMNWGEILAVKESLAEPYLVRRARVWLPQLTDMPDSVVLSCAKRIFDNWTTPVGEVFNIGADDLTKSSAKHRYLLNDQEIAGLHYKVDDWTDRKVFREADVMQAAILKYGSLEGMKMEKKRRQAITEKRRKTIEANRVVARKRQVENEKTFAALLDADGYKGCNYLRFMPDKFDRKELATFYKWIRGPAEHITTEHPVYQTLKARTEEKIVYRMERHHYTDVFRYVSNERFAQLINEKFLK